MAVGDEKLSGLLREKANVPAVLAGDFNVVPTEFDIHPKHSYVDNALLQPEPRAAFNRLLKQGWVDSVRRLYPDDPKFSYWSYMRNRYPRDAGLGSIRRRSAAESQASSSAAAAAQQDPLARFCRREWCPARAPTSMLLPMARWLAVGRLISAVALDRGAEPPRLAIAGAWESLSGNCAQDFHSGATRGPLRRAGSSRGNEGSKSYGRFVQVATPGSLLKWRCLYRALNAWINYGLGRAFGCRLHPRRCLALRAFSRCSATFGFQRAGWSLGLLLALGIRRDSLAGTVRRRRRWFVELLSLGRRHLCASRHEFLTTYEAPLLRHRLGHFRNFRNFRGGQKTIIVEVGRLKFVRTHALRCWGQLVGL